MAKLDRSGILDRPSPDFSKGKLPDNSVATIAQKLHAILQGKDPTLKRLVLQQLEAAREGLERLHASMGKAELREGMTIAGETGHTKVARIDRGRGAIDINVTTWALDHLDGIKPGDTVNLTFDGEVWRSKTFNYGKRDGKFQIVVRNFHEGEFKTPEVLVEMKDARAR